MRPGWPWRAAGAMTADTRSRPRVEAISKVTGRARYGSDVHLAGQLEAGVLRSRWPHARVRATEVARAREVPGVHLVLTADDVALALLTLDDEPRPYVTDFPAAAAPGAVVVQDGDESNVIGETKRYDRGDITAALARAAQVVEATYTTPMQVHHALESHGATAEWDGHTLTVHDSTQSMHDVRDGLADAF